MVPGQPLPPPYAPHTVQFKEQNSVIPIYFERILRFQEGGGKLEQTKKGRVSEEGQRASYPTANRLHIPVLAFLRFTRRLYI